VTLSTGHPSVGRSLPWGIALVLLYMVAAGVRYGPDVAPGRLLLDGMAPLAPYRWLHPPSELARGNQLPAAGAATLALGPSGSPAASVATDDGQATVSLNDNVIAPQGGESSVRVMITPIDPASVAPPPPDMRFDGNAYRFNAVYTLSDRPARLQKPATIVLRYATAATQMSRAATPGSNWTIIKSTNYPGNLQVLVADSETLGIFTTLAPRGLSYVHRTSWWVYAAVAGAPIAALLIGFLPRLLSRRRRGTRQGQKGKRQAR
jgi:hypothetical protein